jgi:hypothetical protein
VIIVICISVVKNDRIACIDSYRMQSSIATELVPTSPSLLINRTTLWDNSSKDDDNNLEKCVAPLTDHAWQSISSLKDYIDTKYGLKKHSVRMLSLTIDDVDQYT